MGSDSNLAQVILGHKTPYLSGQMAIKAITIFTVFLIPAGPMHTVPILACAAAAGGDVALRVAASRSKALSAGKHGSDLLLVTLLLADWAACRGVADADGNVAGEGKGCRALRMVLPFAILVSLGGNAMRLTSRPRTRDDHEQELESGAPRE